MAPRSPDGRPSTITVFGRGGVTGSDLRGLEIDIAGSVHDRLEASSLEEWMQAMRRLGRDKGASETQSRTSDHFPREDLRVVVRPRRLQASRLDEVERLTGIRRESEEPLDGAPSQPAHDISRPQHGGVAGRAW